jgi:hypothetical protein
VDYNEEESFVEVLIRRQDVNVKENSPLRQILKSRRKPSHDQVLDFH